MAASSWIRNFGTSVKFGAIDMAKEMNPAITNLYTQNSEFFNGIADTVRDIYRGQSRMSKLMERTGLGKEQKDMVKDALLDLKSDVKTFIRTGKFARKDDSSKRMEKYLNKAMGFEDMDMDMSDMSVDMNMGDTDSFDDNFDMGGDESLSLDDLPSPEELQKSTSTPETGPSQQAVTAEFGTVQIASIEKGNQINAIYGQKTVEGLSYVNDSIIQQTHILQAQLVKSTEMNYKQMITMLEAQQSNYTKQEKTLETINENIANIITFNQDTILKWSMGAMKYYDDSLAELKKISAGMERLAPEKKEEEERKSDFDLAGLRYGGFDIQGYLSLVKQNFMNNSTLGGILGMLEPDKMLPMTLNNLFGTFMSWGMKKFVPKIVESTMKELNHTVENFFPALFSKLGSMGSDYNESEIFQSIGSIFGVKLASTSFDTSKFEKGAVPWTGISDKTLNQVIPTYLSKIVALLSGGQERMFNYSTGKFETMQDIRRREESEKDSYVRSAFGDSYYDLKDLKYAIDFRSDREEKEFDDYLKLFFKSVTTSGKFFDVNKANLMDFNSNLNNPIFNQLLMGTIRSLPEWKQIELAGASLKYNQKLFENMQRKSKDGDFSQYVLHSDFTDKDTIRDVNERNRRVTDEGLPAGSIIGPYDGKTKERELSDETRRGYGEDSEKIKSDDLIGKSPEELAQILTNYRANQKKKKEEAKKEGDKAAENDENGEEITGSIRKFIEKASRYLKKPGQLLADAIKGVDKTLYRILFGAKPGEDSLLKTFIKNAKDLFKRVSTWIKTELFSPLKRFLFGEDFRKSNFYLMFKGMFDKASNFFRGEKDSSGNYSNGLMSSMFNEMGDTGKAIRNFFTGKEYKRSDGTTVGYNSDNVFSNMKSTFSSIFSTFSKYMIGDSVDQRNADGSKKPFIDVILDKIGQGLGALGSFITGSSNVDNAVIQKDYAKIIKEKAPKTISYGILGGIGLTLATPGLGILGMFLPGGLIGSMLLATGISALHQNDRFMRFLYGEKGADGKRTGGVISAKLQEFFRKNKTGLAGGAIMGTITGLTGFSIPGMVMSLLGFGGLGLFPAIISSTIGPVLLGSIVGLAVKNERFHKFLFGSGDPADGEKAVGILNGKVAGKIKDKLPLAIGGGLLGFGGMTLLGNFGILGMLAINPWLGALIGGALGIGAASKKFKEALFGKYDEKSGKFIKGGLVDVFKNAINMEILKPLGIFGEKTLLAIRRTVFNNIMLPMMRIMEPYKLFISKIFTGVGSGIKNIFKTIGDKIKAAFSPITSLIGKLLMGIFDLTRHAMSSVVRGTVGIAGGILGIPFRLLGIPASLITAHTKLFGKDEEKERLKQAEENIKQLKEDKEKEFKEIEKDIKEREKELKQDRKDARRSGYEATSIQLAEKTVQFHAELNRITEGNKELASEQVKELISVNENIKDTNSLLSTLKIDIDTFLAGTSFNSKEEIENSIKGIRDTDEERHKRIAEEAKSRGEEIKELTEDEKRDKEENDKNVINGIRRFIGINSVDTGPLPTATESKDNKIEGRHPIGQRVVNKTGTYVLSEGEMVIPATQNPYNNKDISIQDAINSENNVIYKFLSENQKVSIDVFNDLIDAVRENTRAVKNIDINIEPQINASIEQTVGSAIPSAAAGTNNSGLNLTDLLSGKKETAEGIADINAGIGRDADKDVKNLLGRRTADIILKERKEDKFRDDLLLAIRGIGKNFKDSAKEKTKSIFDSIKDLLGGLGDLAKLFAFGTLIAALDKLSDKIQKFLDWFKNGDGKGGPPLPDDYHDQRLVEDAAKIGGRAIYKGAQRALRARGTTLETEAAKLAKNTRLIPQQLKARYGRGEEALEHANQLRNKNTKLAEDIRILDDEIKAKQSTATSIKDKVKIQELQEARESIVKEMEKNTQIATRVESRATRSIADVSTKDIRKEAIEGIKDLEVSKIMDAVVDGFTKAINSIRLSSPVRTILESDGIEKICKSLEDVKKKITANKVAKMAGYISIKMAKLMGKTAAILGSGGTAIAVFGFIDGALGAYDAAELFHVNPEDVTAGMRTVAAVFNAFMGLPYIWYIDIGLEIAYLATDGAVDIKAYLLKMIYDAIPVEDKANIEELQAKSTDEFKEWKKKDENKNKDYGDFQKYKSSQYTPVANFIRENVPYGEYLSGKNDENGEFQHGLLSAMGASYDQHSVINIPGIIADGTKKALLGGVDSDGKFHKGIFTDTDIGQSISDVLANIFGEEDTNDYKGKDSVITGFINDLNKEFDNTLAYVFGESDIGEYKGQKGLLTEFVETTRGDLNETLAYLFGEMDVGEYKGNRGAILSFIEETQSNLKGTLAYLFGEMDVGDYKGQDGLVSKFIDDTRISLNNSLAYIFGEMSVGDYKGKEGLITKMISEFKVSITDKVTSFIKSLSDGFNNIIDSLFKGPLNGASNIIDSITNIFKGIFNNKAKTDNTINTTTSTVTPTTSYTTIGSPIITNVKKAGSGIDKISDELALDILQGKAGSGLLTESQRNSKISDKPLVPSNPDYGSMKDLGCGIEALTDQFKKFSGNITSNDVRNKVSTNDVANRGQKGLTPYGLNNIANKSGFSMRPVDPSNDKAVKNVIREKGILGGVGPAINPIGRGAGHYVSSKGTFTKNGKEYAVLGDPMGNGLPRISNIDDVVKGIQAGGPNLAATINKGGSGFSSMLGGGLYGGSGIKSWLVKKIAGNVLTESQINELENKISGHPNLELALKTIDTFDPISLLMMPFESMNRIDSDIKSGKLRAEDLSHLEDSYYGGSGNEMRIDQQGPSDCTAFSTRAMWRAYKDEERPDITTGNWASELDTIALETNFGNSDSEKSRFINFINEFYNQKPNHPMVLYQTGGLGKQGDHPINHGGGNHATVLGRRLDNGLYEDYDPNGARVHVLPLDQIFDSSAEGGKEGMPPGGGNSVWVPKIEPSSPIDKWQGTGASDTKGTASIENSKESSGIGSIVKSITSSDSGGIVGGILNFGNTIKNILGGFLESLLLGKEYKGDTGATKQSTTSNSSDNINTLSSGSSITTADSMDEKQIWDWFIGKGYSPEVTAGIMGRLKQETGTYNPKYEKFQEADGYEVGGFGMFQWTYGDGEGYNYPDPMGADKSTVYEKYPDSRLVKYMKWVDSNGKGNYESAGNELEYLYDKDMKEHEYFATLSRQLSGYPRATTSINSWYPNDFNKITNPKDALLKWGSDYEIGIWEDVGETYADEIYNKYKGGSGLLNLLGGSGVENGDQLIQQSHDKYAGLPYVLGGDGVNSLDCGLFTQLALRDAGYNLDSRCADFQYAEFKDKGAINSVEAAKAGDLVFFQNTYDPGPQDPPVVEDITHVGFAAGDGQISHSGNPNKIMPLAGSSLQEKIYASGSIEKMFGIKPGKDGGLVSTNPNKITTDSAPSGSSPVTNTSTSSNTPTSSSTSSSGGLDGFSKFTNLLKSIFGKFTSALFSGKEYTGLSSSEWSNAIGGNSNINPSSSFNSSSSSNTTGDSLDEKQIYDWFKSKGYNDEATSGIMGRVKQEHNFNPKLSDKKIHYDPQYGGELGGMGIFQWTWDSAGENLPDTNLDINEYFKQGSQMHPDSRLANYIKWCDEKGKPYESTASQLDYFWEVDKDAQNYFADYYAGIPNWNPETLNQFDRATVAQKWTAGFERGAPSENDTIYANEIYDKYAGKGGSGLFVSDGNNNMNSFMWDLLLNNNKPNIIPENSSSDISKNTSSKIDYLKILMGDKEATQNLSNAITDKLYNNKPNIIPENSSSDIINKHEIEINSTNIDTTTKSELEKYRMSIDNKIEMIKSDMNTKIEKFRLPGNDEVVDAIRSTDIHSEVQAIVQYLEMIVKGQKDMNTNLTVGFKETGPGITNGGGKTVSGILDKENNPTLNFNVPVLQHDIQEIRDKHGQDYDYASIHSKNLEIARGGKFKDA